MFGGALGLVLGSLRLPAVILASGSAATAAGTNIAVSAASALTGGIAHARELLGAAPFLLVNADIGKGIELGAFPELQLARDEGFARLYVIRTPVARR